MTMQAKSGQDELDQTDSIGEAWLHPDLSITLHFYRTSDGMPVSADYTYYPTDKAYKEIMAHIGEMRIGEPKLIYPFPD